MQNHGVDYATDEVLTRSNSPLKQSFMLTQWEIEPVQIVQARSVGKDLERQSYGNRPGVCKHERG